MTKNNKKISKFVHSLKVYQLEIFTNGEKLIDFKEQYVLNQNLKISKCKRKKDF